MKKKDVMHPRRLFRKQSSRPDVNSIALEEQSRAVTPTHQEHHSNNGDVIRDVIIGFADGLTVPFALTAGLSSLGSSRLVVIGGLAELFSGSISMGLGAYLAAVTDADHYKAEEARERAEVREKPQAEEQEIYDIMATYGIGKAETTPIIDALKRDPDMWIKVNKISQQRPFMMDFELQLEKPNTSRAWISALTMGLSYFIGGIIPMIPYFAMTNVTHALFISIGITVVILISFGYLKARITDLPPQACLKSAAQTLIVGSLAAGTSYGIVRAINSKGGAI